jgi:hypothetical protein
MRIRITWQIEVTAESVEEAIGRAQLIVSEPMKTISDEDTIEMDVQEIEVN